MIFNIGGLNRLSPLGGVLAAMVKDHGFGPILSGAPEAMNPMVARTGQLSKLFYFTVDGVFVEITWAIPLGNQFPCKIDPRIDRGHGVIACLDYIQPTAKNPRSGSNKRFLSISPRYDHVAEGGCQIWVML